MADPLPFEWILREGPLRILKRPMLFQRLMEGRLGQRFVDWINGLRGGG